MQLVRCMTQGLETLSNPPQEVFVGGCLVFVFSTLLTILPSQWVRNQKKWCNLELTLSVQTLLYTVQMQLFMDFIVMLHSLCHFLPKVPTKSSTIYI